MFLFLRPARLLLTALIAQTTARQLSLGLALGVWLGLVPKGNLLAVAMGLVLASLRVNLGIATTAAVIVSFLSISLDSLFDRIGSWVLGHPELQNLWTQLYNSPLMPWTDFNNSIVTGSFLVGAVLVWPIHRLSLPWIAEYMDVVSDYARRWRWMRLMMGAEWADRLGSVE